MSYEPTPPPFQFPAKELPFKSPADHSTHGQADAYSIVALALAGAAFVLLPMCAPLSPMAAVPGLILAAFGRPGGLKVVAIAANALTLALWVAFMAWAFSTLR